MKFVLDLKHLDILYVLIPVFQDIALTFRKKKSNWEKKITFFLDPWGIIEALFFFKFLILYKFLFFRGESLKSNPGHHTQLQVPLCSELSHGAKL